MTYLGIKKIQIIPKSIKIKSDRFILFLYDYRLCGLYYFNFVYIFQNKN